MRVTWSLMPGPWRLVAVACSGQSRPGKRPCKPTVTGRTELRMTPQQFIGRLAALTPPPWLNAIRFHGIFASASAHRRVVAQRVAAAKDPHDDPFCCRPLRRDHVT